MQSQRQKQSCPFKKTSFNEVLQLHQSCAFYVVVNFEGHTIKDVSFQIEKKYFTLYLLYCFIKKVEGKEGTLASIFFSVVNGTENKRPNMQGSPWFFIDLISKTSSKFYETFQFKFLPVQKEMIERSKKKVLPYNLPKTCYGLVLDLLRIFYECFVDQTRDCHNLQVNIFKNLNSYQFFRGYSPTLIRFGL